MTDPICRATELRKRFGAVEALRGVSLEIPGPGVHAIIGPSGSGKTTLLNALSGLERVDSGTVELCGRRVDRMTTQARIDYRAQIAGFVFQRFNLIPSLTVRQNIELPCHSRGRRPDPVWLTKLSIATGVDEVLERYPSELSGGQQQRVAIIRALLDRPKVVFADEPTGNLDSDAGRSIIDLLHELGTEYGLAVLLVTHDLGLTSQHASVTVLRDGGLMAHEAALRT